MPRGTLFLLLAICLTCKSYCQGEELPHSDLNSDLKNLRREVSENLISNILPYWSEKMPDNINGGFFGRIDGKETVYQKADKGGILNARILWTYSSAFRILKDSSYFRMAKRAREYIVSHFIDRKYGGAYRSLHADGTPSDTRKQIYTNAFFIYGLCEYYRATGDSMALSEAMNIFRVIENHAFDREFNGYFESFKADWARDNSDIAGKKTDPDQKSMNTSLHIMEAYTNLYRVSFDEYVGSRLKNIVELFLERIIDRDRWHLICFFDRELNGTSDIDSYGHDIECSWLIYEAAVLLGDRQLIERAGEASVRIATAASEGFQKDGSMLSEKDNSTGKMRPQRSWWEQAESVVGFLNAYQITGDMAFLDKSVRCWEYIKNNFVDYKNGGWYPFVSDKGEAGGDKAGFWICPYHSGRMCMEVIERCNEK